MRARACIIGLGLIGGSLGAALRRAGWSVAYVDPQVTERAAREAGAADMRLDSPAGDIVVLATPVDVAAGLLRGLPEDAETVTSVCSVMQPLEAVGRKGFVAGHPFAGSERSGLAAADASLFQYRPWFLARSDAAVEQMIEAAGAVAHVVDAAEHDRVMALTSHLPQVVSTALASLLAGVDPRFVGSGARSLLRLAASPAGIWEPVLEANRENLDAAVEALVHKLRNLTRDDFERANRFR